MILRELGLSYETKWINLRAGEHKSPEFTKYNPNGRIPALIDHFYNDFVVWCVLIKLAFYGILKF
jgi:glutathione S-transferase